MSYGWGGYDTSDELGLPPPPSFQSLSNFDEPAFGDAYPQTAVTRSAIGTSSMGSASMMMGDAYRFHEDQVRSATLGMSAYSSFGASAFGDSPTFDSFPGKSTFDSFPGKSIPQMTASSQQDSDIAEFTSLHLPRDLPTADFFQVAVTALVITCMMPFQLGNVLVRFMTERNALDLKVKPLKYTIKGEVCHHQGSCVVKLRVYRDLDKLIIELNRRRGDALAFADIFRQLEQYLGEHFSPVEMYPTCGEQSDSMGIDFMGGPSLFMEPPPLNFDFASNFDSVPDMPSLEGAPRIPDEPLDSYDLEEKIAQVARAETLPESVQAEVAYALLCGAQSYETAHLLCRTDVLEGLGRLSVAPCEETQRYATEAFRVLASHQEAQHLFATNSYLAMLKDDYSRAPRSKQAHTAFNKSRPFGQ